MLQPQIRPVEESLSLTEGKVTNVDIPRDALIWSIGFKLKVVTTTNSTTVNRLHEGILPAIARIEVIADGKDTIVSLDANAIHKMNSIYNGCYPLQYADEADTLWDYDNKATAEDGLYATTKSFVQNFMIPFAMPRAIKPLDTLLDARKFSTLTLRITTGVFGDISEAGLTAITPTVDIWLWEMRGAPADFESVYQKRLTLKTTPTATGEKKIDIPVGNSYRGFFIYVVRNSTPFLPDFAGATDIVSTALNRIKLESGTRVYWNQTPEQNRAFMKEIFRLDVLPAGWYFIDFALDGYIRQALQTQNLSSLKLVLDSKVSSGWDFYVYPIEIVR